MTTTTEAANAEYVEAVQATLTAHLPGWVINGQSIHAPYPAQSPDEDERAAIAEEIAGIDAGAILARHERGQA